jgi:sugar transferase (PEP-CTERM system associated)
LIRLFHVYYPIRTLILLIGEALIVWTSFLLGVVYEFGPDSYLELNVAHGYYKIFGLTLLVLLCSHGFDLYDTARLNTKGELYFRLLMLSGVMAFILAGVAWVKPDFLLGGGASTFGLIILTVALIGWRLVFTWLVRLPILVERVYVLGIGERALRLVQGLRQNPEIGVEIASWTGKMEGAITRESVAAHLMEAVHKQKVHRVILAMEDRRGTIPMRELLFLRMQGIKVDEATSWLEKISNKIEVENLYPSWLVLAEGFRSSNLFIVVRRALSVVLSLIGFILALPLIPFIMLAIGGPDFYTQARVVGKNGRLFKVLKFRTIREDAEAENGPQWVVDNDPRVTRVGKFLRALRLDDIPQLWSVLKGDMAFVGPRPERPEFVELLSKDIPYYGLRHMVRPGLTGWAQVKYQHVGTVEDAREELQYDLFYIKNASIGLDLLIIFQTIKTILLTRSAQ